jgi:hypothetical protein
MNNVFHKSNYIPEIHVKLPVYSETNFLNLLLFIHSHFVTYMLIILEEKYKCVRNAKQYSLLNCWATDLYSMSKRFFTYKAHLLATSDIQDSTVEWLHHIHIEYFTNLWKHESMAIMFSFLLTKNSFFSSPQPL